MIELPEAAVLAGQLNRKIKGRKIIKVTAAQSPHKFAWYQGDPKNYSKQLKDKIINKALSVGGMVEIKTGSVNIVFTDGVGLKFYTNDTQLPKKHQLLIEFDNSTFLAASIQMYGGILCFKEGEGNNKYYLIAKEKPSPLSKKFNDNYFNKIIYYTGMQNKSVKFLLATEQRIPGLGNGVLQDILFDAGIHPKHKVEALTGKEKFNLYKSIKTVLADMIQKGGRDTEKDLFGNNGGYITRMSKNTAGKPCPNCGTVIKKENYMGGSIYFCSKCQKIG